jgi:queuine tRNA-ribosyltransferase
MFKFEITAKDKESKARVGEITTAHGIIKTPSFVPVGTKASVRSLAPQDLKDLNVQIVFGNTYHLHLQPGEDIVRDFGGIAKFMNWNGPTITDSGGFQVFSLAKANRGPAASFPPATAPSASASVRGVGNPSSVVTSSVKFMEDKEDDESEENLVKITEDGVMFRSHIDGSKHMFTPEKSIEIQKKLGADLIVAFDECAPHPSTYDYTKAAMERTHRWATRSLEASKLKQYHPWQQALYGIVQGGIYEDLRKESAKFISKMAFGGIAIGGVSVGESKQEMRDVLEWTIPYLPDEKPRHLLGIGEVDDIFSAIENGIDTFDCVIPTRFGRYGIIFAGAPEGNIKNKFRIDLNKGIFATDQGPMCKDCNCYVCKNFTRGYIHHLFKANELSAYRMASYHNIYFLINLVNQIREAILNGNFGELKEKWLNK